MQKFAHFTFYSLSVNCQHCINQNAYLSIKIHDLLANKYIGATIDNKIINK